MIYAIDFSADRQQRGTENPIPKLFPPNYLIDLLRQKKQAAPGLARTA
jgi:hypothetical protein